MPRQDANYSNRMCDCGRYKLMKQYNPALDGRQVCTSCVIDDVHKRKGVEA